MERIDAQRMARTHRCAAGCKSTLQPVSARAGGWHVICPVDKSHAITKDRDPVINPFQQTHKQRQFHRAQSAYWKNIIKKGN